MSDVNVNFISMEALPNGFSSGRSYEVSVTKKKELEPYTDAYSLTLTVRGILSKVVLVKEQIDVPRGLLENLRDQLIDMLGSAIEEGGEDE